MEQVLGEIPLAYTDSDISELLKREGQAGCAYTYHFNQAEDFFLLLEQPFEVPSFSIHHDVRNTKPTPQYLDSLTKLMDQLQARLPQVFAGLTYMFDPSETLRPVFFQVYRVAGRTYLWVVRLDLVFRPALHTATTPGSNDMTPVYSSRKLILEADVVPLAGVKREDNRVRSFTVDQLISDTWIGETGRGYFVQGIWLDADLTKFFSKLALPLGTRSYPYYPFSSKFRTVCHSPIGLEVEQRKLAIPRLHRVKDFIAPHLDAIQQTLREQEFTVELKAFADLKRQVPESWDRWWDGFAVKAYLNDDEMKEFEVSL